MKVGCNGVIIKDQDEHLQITSFEGAATLSILQTFIEVAYIKITGYNDTKEPDSKLFTDILKNSKTHWVYSNEQIKYFKSYSLTELKYLIQCHFALATPIYLIGLK